MLTVGFGLIVVVVDRGAGMCVVVVVVGSVIAVGRRGHVAVVAAAALLALHRFCWRGWFKFAHSVCCLRFLCLFLSPSRATLITIKVSPDTADINNCVAWLATKENTIPEDLFMDGQSPRLDQ